ncbi:MAG: Glu-tRNA(Gln) amidotransferase subunit GatE [Candidatus Altiarchaeota archaeon]|nr:Glu-tRNA(Gln) amidotransferase subunit GatE [Candidatus Altiarchaeota archaeon]
MTDINYKTLGFKCGIEIHQQLETHKLFCECPSIIREDEPDIVVRRKMRAVAGEIGNVDPAALYEYLRDKEMIYQAYRDTTCLVELDEEPPHPLNEEALDTVLEASLLLNAKPVDELQVMRKTVIDGSNTSGFQRTILVAMDGHLETEEGRVRIPTICLEEDAARKIGEEKDTTVYRLDRLSIPLIEIATTPDIKNPGHAREVAEKLGMILRATGKVRRGLGTIRQDLNVSIREGERVEIKGVQDLRLIEDVLRKEVERQLMLVEVKKELKKRGAKAEDLDYGFVDVTPLFKNTKSTIVAKMLEKGAKVMAVRLTGFKGLLKGRLGPELAQYAKAGSGVKGIFHSDELPDYGITEEEVKAVEDRLKIKDYKAFALVVEEKETAEKALAEVVNRCKTAIDGVPEETRKAKPDATTEFMRPLPGSARMYPETDEALLVITEGRIERIKRDIPELPEERLERYLKKGLNQELANQLIKSRSSETFDELSEKFPEIKASTIANTILSMPKEVRKRYNVDTSSLRKEHYEGIFKEIMGGRTTKEFIPDIMAALAADPEKSVEKVIEEKGLQSMTEEGVEELVGRLISENKGMTFGALMGKTMAELKGRADAEAVKEIIHRKLQAKG